MHLQEDLCLMKVAEDGSLRFVSGAVLFPQRWSLAEKLGMDMRCVACFLSVNLLMVRFWQRDSGV